MIIHEAPIASRTSRTSWCFKRLPRKGKPFRAPNRFVSDIINYIKRRHPNLAVSGNLAKTPKSASEPTFQWQNSGGASQLCFFTDPIDIYHKPSNSPNQTTCSRSFLRQITYQSPSLPITLTCPLLPPCLLGKTPHFLSFSPNFRCIPSGKLK